MISIYGYRWSSVFGSSIIDKDGNLTIAADTWMKALTGIDEKQIANGLSKCIINDEIEWITAPKFRSICLNIPSLADVKKCVINKKTDNSPFVLLVLKEIDSWAFYRANQDVADKMIQEAYKEAKRRVMSGEFIIDSKRKLTKQEDFDKITGKQDEQ